MIKVHSVSWHNARGGVPFAPLPTVASLRYRTRTGAVPRKKVTHSLTHSLLIGFRRILSFIRRRRGRTVKAVAVRLESTDGDNEDDEGEVRN